MTRPTSYRPFRGVRTQRRPETLLDLCSAYHERADEDEFFSHATAAQLWGIPLPSFVARAREVHVSVLAPAFPPDMRGVIGHRLTSASRSTVHGLPVIRAAEAWAQLGPLLSVDDLVVAGDHLVCRKRPLATLEQLREVVAAGAGCRGIRRLRDALALVRTRTDSPQESRLRLLLIHAALPEPLVGYEVRHDGYFVGTPDLAYPDERIAIEYEGEVHATDLQTFRDDIERRERFEDAGWRVIRVTADHLRKPAVLLARITRALVQRRP